MIAFLLRYQKRIYGLLLAGLVLGFAAAWIFGTCYSRPCNHPVPLPKNLAVEPVTFTSASGATIRGWLAGSATNQAVVILQHGIHADKSTLVSRAEFLSRAGYAVLLYDFQAHGESLGKQITFGHLESQDAQAAVAFAKHRFPGRPIAVIGVSLGAAAAVLADPPLDVQALVLEMMYPTLTDGVKDRIEMRLGRPGRCLSPLLTAQLPLRMGFSADDLRPAAHLQHLSVPKLILAGTEDRETKFAEVQAMFADAADPKILVPFQGAKHEDLLGFQPGQYQQTVLQFLAANLQ